MKVTSFKYEVPMLRKKTRKMQVRLYAVNDHIKEVITRHPQTTP
jgi:hypothetical protein